LIDYSTNVYLSVFKVYVGMSVVQFFDDVDVSMDSFGLSSGHGHLLE